MSDFITLPCKFDKHLIETRIRCREIAYLRKWRDGNGVDGTSCALYLRSGKNPIRVLVHFQGLSETLPGVILFSMCKRGSQDKEPILINPESIRYYRRFVDNESTEHKYIIFLEPKNNIFLKEGDKISAADGFDEVRFIVSEDPAQKITEY